MFYNPIIASIFKLHCVLFSKVLKEPEKAYVSGLIRLVRFSILVELNGHLKIDTSKATTTCELGNGRTSQEFRLVNRIWSLPPLGVPLSF